MQKTLLGLLALVVFLSTELTQAQSVTSAPDLNASLDDKWEWGSGKAESTRGDTWIAFSFERMMCEHCFVGSFHDGRKTQRATLEEQLLGTTSSPISVERAARRALDDIDGHEDRMVMKSMAVLVHVSRGQVIEVDVSSMQSHFNFEGESVFWLGASSTSESFGLLKEVYSDRLAEEAQKGIVWAVGSLRLGESALPFLTGIARNNRSTEVRKAAVYSIGNQQVREAVSVLKRVIEEDEDREVQKAAIYSLGNNNTQEARQALLSIIQDMGRISSS